MDLPRLPGRTDLCPPSFSPQTKEELLAYDIARSFGELQKIKIYLNLLEKYSEDVIRRAWGQVKETPPEKIIRSKAAYFIYLAKLYGKTKT